MFRAVFLIAFAALLALFLPHAGNAGEKGPYGVKWEFTTGKSMPLATVKDEKKPYLYVAAKNGGLLVLDISDRKGAERVASIGTEKLAGLDVMHLAKQGDYVYLALGDFFDTKGQPAGIAIIDVSDPLKPSLTAIRVTDSKLHGSPSILVSGRFAYLAAMEYGVFIFDIDEKDKITPVSHIRPYPDFPREKPNRVQQPNARGMALEGSKLYLAYDSGGIRVFDLFDKQFPKEIGLYVNPALLQKQQAYNNIVIDGKYAYAAVDYCGLEIIDISDPRNMKPAGWWNPWHCEKFSALWLNSPGHTNQIALDKKRKTVYLSGGDSELLSVDVSNPEKPVTAPAYGHLRDSRAVWGMTLDGKDIYLSYITAFVPFRSTWNGIKAVSVKE